MKRNVTLFDVKKVQQAAAKATKKGIADATAYLWTVAKNSVRKRDGRKKQFPLHIIDNEGRRTESVKEHLAKPKRANERVVVHSNPGTGKKRSTGNVREPQTTANYNKKTASQPGKTPHSHKSFKPGWPDYWLRKGVVFDKENGIVYVNPPHVNKSEMSQSIPQLIEMGGPAISYKKNFMGYRLRTRKFKNGQVHVTYKEVFWGDQPRQPPKPRRYQMKPRPFLKPALEKAAKKLVQILKGSINK